MTHIKCFLAALVFLAGSTLAAVSDQPPGQKWKEYPYSDPNSKIVFPKDEGAHPSVSALEWWYVVMHVTGRTTGEKYSVLVPHFTNTFRFFTISNVSRHTHTSATTRGKLTAKKGHLEVEQATQWGTDTMRTSRDETGELVPFTYEMKTHGESIALEARISAEKSPLMLGKTGWVPVGSRGWSWYYSQTRMTAEGTLTHAGITEAFDGIAWMDHQWGPFLISPVEGMGIFESYEWFCLQLDDGSDLMISNIYNSKHELPEGSAYGGVALVRPDGTKDQVSKKDFKRLGYWQDPDSKKYMSMGWTLDVPEWNLHLRMEPESRNQMVKFPLNGDFWEGSTRVSGSINGREVTGRGFGELMHQYEVPKILVYPVFKPIRKDVPIRVRWKVTNPDDGNPLSYDVDLVSEDSTVKLASGIKVNQFEFSPAELKAVKESKKHKVRITAYSSDRVIRSSAESWTF